MGVAGPRNEVLARSGGTTWLCRSARWDDDHGARETALDHRADIYCFLMEWATVGRRRPGRFPGGGVDVKNVASQLQVAGVQASLADAWVLIGIFG